LVFLNLYRNLIIFYQKNEKKGFAHKKSRPLQPANLMVFRPYQ